MKGKIIDRWKRLAKTRRRTITDASMFAISVQREYILQSEDSYNDIKEWIKEYQANCGEPLADDEHFQHIFHAQYSQ